MSDSTPDFDPRPTQDPEVEDLEVVSAPEVGAPTLAPRKKPGPPAGRPTSGKRHSVYAQTIADPGTGRRDKRSTVQRAPKPHVVAAQRRNYVARLLAGPEEKPLDIILENMRWNMAQARKEESLAGDVLTKDTLEVIREYRAEASDAAMKAAPYIHARLAPIVPKGESGLVVNLIIEDS